MANTDKALDKREILTSKASPICLANKEEGEKVDLDLFLRLPHLATSFADSPPVPGQPLAYTRDLILPLQRWKDPATQELEG